MITILGKSEATLTFVADNMAHRALEFGQHIKVINNLGLPDHLEYKHPFYKWDELEAITPDLKNFVLGVYRPTEKVKALALFKIAREKFVNAIHANTSISATAMLGRGLLINSNVSIAAYANLADFVSVNRNASIGHHTLLQDFVTVNPNASIGGNCIVGEGTTIGIGAVVIDGIKIGCNCIIGAGSVVTKDIPDNTKGFGIPFREK